MMKKSVAVIAAVVVVIAAAVGIFLWQKNQANDGPAPSATPTPSAGASKKPADKPAEKRGGPGGQPSVDVVYDDDPKGPLQLEGQVLDSDDLPVGGATIVLGSKPPRTATSEADGSFSFKELVPRAYELRAHKDDLAGGPVLYELTASSDPVAIRMATGATLVITVVDEAEKPIRGAAVEMRDGDDARQASSDSQGIARFRGVQSGFVEIVARAPGHGVALRLLQIPPRPGVSVDARLVLSRGAAVSGKVVDDSGKPVRGARVVMHDASAVFSAVDPRRDGVVSDDQGKFRLPALAAGTYRFSASHKDHAPGGTDLITLDGVTEKNDIVITLEAGGVLAGKVVDKAGQAVPFATVRVASGGASGFGLTRGSARQATSDEAGAFEIRGLARTELRVVARSDSASSEAVDVDLRSGTEKLDLVLTLTIAGSIAGIVVDSAGEPVAEAQVSALPDFLEGASIADLGLRGMAADTSDGGGHFELGGLPDGKYRVRASRTHMSSRQFWQPGEPATTGQKDVRIVLDSPGSVTGKLVFENGAAATAFTVTVGFPPGVPIIDRAGAFTVGDLVPGKYDVSFRGPEFATRTVADVVIKPGETTDLGTVQASRGRTVSGRVIDASGNPVPAAAVIIGRQLFGDGKSVQADLGSGTEEFLGVKRVVSGADGSYRIAGVDKGDLQIVAEHTEKGRSLPVAVTAGTADLTIPLALRPFGRVSGRVLAGGAPVPGASVFASAKGGGNQMLLVQSGDDGSYVFDRLPEGAHRITASMSQEALGSSNSAGVDVEVQAGERVTADISIEVGDITLEVTIAGKDNAHIDAAQVFLFKGNVSPRNGKEVSEVFLQMSQSGGAMMAFSLGGKPATLSNVSPATYSLCTIPINGNLQDPNFTTRLQQNAQLLAAYCEQKAVAAAPVKQTHTAVVPPMNPLPTPSP